MRNARGGTHPRRERGKKYGKQHETVRKQNCERGEKKADQTFLNGFADVAAKKEATTGKKFLQTNQKRKIPNTHRQQLAVITDTTRRREAKKKKREELSPHSSRAFLQAYKKE
jgi:hypothetical protein